MDPCGDVCRLAQIEWLKANLAAANTNRESVPWIVAGSHFPFYCTGCTAKQMSAEYYASSDAEMCGNVNFTASKKCSSSRTLEAGSAASISDLVPVLQDNSVDLYVAGHWHYYESVLPGTLGSTGAGGVPLQTDFVNPNVTVHVTSGNGGPREKTPSGKHARVRHADASILRECRRRSTRTAGLMHSIERTYNLLNCSTQAAAFLTSG